MDFAAVTKDGPFCLLSGCSDVVHLDGIGGYGRRDTSRTSLPDCIPPSGWSMDCLPKSGLLRLWPSSGEMLIGMALSSFEVYAMPRRPRKV
jgi:hypothetical protein